MAAEVINLDRSIVIQGDSQRFDNGGGKAHYDNFDIGLGKMI